MNLRNDIINILTKCATGAALSVEESILLEGWKAESNENRELFNELMLENSRIEQLKVYAAIDVDNDWLTLQGRLNPIVLKKQTWLYKVLPYAAALGIGLFLYLAYYYNTAPKDAPIIAQIDSVQNDVNAATQGATLVLADGRRVELDQKANITNNQGVTLNSTGTELQVAVDPNEVATPSAPNVIIVPKGAFYTVILADQTKVWVNANSKLTFPSAFTSAERRVKIEGEAYFEVSPDSKRPFFVDAKDMQIKVLGTKFNVNAYADHVKTTLEEGKVNLLTDKINKTLIPGQMSIWDGRTIKVGPANLAKEMAWKNKEFRFENDDIVHIAYELSRWYDVQVKFVGNIDMKKQYSGNMSRELSLAKVLNVLQFGSDFKFKIQDKELLIMSK